MSMIRCISIRQPYAHFVVEGLKPIENRVWTTKYRGKLLIHATAKPDDDPDFTVSVIHHDFCHIKGWEFPGRMALGCIIGSVDLVDVVENSDNYWFDGPYGFVFDNEVKFENPIPWKGQQKFYSVDWPVKTKSMKPIKYYTPKLIERQSVLDKVKNLFK